MDLSMTDGDGDKLARVMLIAPKQCQQLPRVREQSIETNRRHGVLCASDHSCVRIVNILPLAAASSSAMIAANRNRA
jgi:hypothetical protein